MNSKKKLIIAFSALGVVALSAVIALVAVIAAFNTTTESGISISYTAVNVNATISGKWGYATHKADGENLPTVDQNLSPATITFIDADTDELVKKNFNSISAEMTKTKTRVYVVYTIVNNDAVNAITVTATDNVSTADDNIKVEYAILTSDAVTANDTWSETLDVEDTTIAANGGTQYIAVRFKMVDRTKNVNFASAITFSLAVASIIN